MNNAKGGKVTRCCKSMVDSSWFFPVTMAVVLLNAVWIGWEADNSQDVLVISEASIFVRIIENTFCSVFFVELVVRFLAIPEKKRFYRDGWFDFDLILVIF